MNSNIGKKLKKLRLQLGLSQKEMSDKINLSQSTYNRFERGVSKTWIHYVVIICETLGIKPEELMLNEKIGESNLSPINQIINSEQSFNKISSLYDKLLLEKDKRIAELEEKIIMLNQRKFL